MIYNNSSPRRIAIAGASGRMGRMLIEAVLQAGDTQLAGALDIAKIGNGTKVTALVGSYRHKMSSKFGAAPSIGKIIVTDLVVYGEDVEGDDDDIL